MGLFGSPKKEDPLPFEAPASVPSQEQSSQGPPIEQIITLQKQGLTPNQIVEALQRNGYSSTQIMDAMNQAEAKRGVEAMPPPGQYQQQESAPSGGYEQLAESIVNERWQQFTKELSKWSEWKDKTDMRIDKAEQAILDLRNAVESLHKALVSKISDYDKNLLDVGTEIKAMERVFQKILPSLAENVSELGRITKNMKETK